MTKKIRLDQALVLQGLVGTRSQAESYIKLGRVKINGEVVTKPGLCVRESAKLSLASERYVSRAGLKLAAANQVLGVDFKGKTVLDVGSSTGGFSEYGLRSGAKKVIAVDVGSSQLHASLRANSKVELHEKTDIRNFQTKEKPDIVLADVSFISLKDILPAVAKLCKSDTQLVVLAKPQFEAGKNQTSRGIVKNNTIRRAILSNLEIWFKKSFVIAAKTDSDIAGAKGNRERFYLLECIS